MEEKAEIDYNPYHMTVTGLDNTHVWDHYCSSYDIVHNVMLMIHVSDVNRNENTVGFPLHQVKKMEIWRVKRG